MRRDVASIIRHDDLFFTRFLLIDGQQDSTAGRFDRDEILVFANPDTELQCDIGPLIRHLEEEKTAAAFGRLRYPDGTTQRFIRNFPTFLTMFGELFGLPTLFPQWTALSELVRDGNHEVYDRPRFIEAASGAFFVMRKEVYASVGMFDEDFFVYGEETDLFFRLKEKGYVIFYDPGVEIIHHHGKSTSGNPAMYTMLQANKYRFVKKHYSRPFALIYRYMYLFLFDVTRFSQAKLRSVFTSGKRREESRAGAEQHKEAIFWELFNKDGLP